MHCVLSGAIFQEMVLRLRRSLAKQGFYDSAEVLWLRLLSSD